jgi:hypothetical protein
MGRILPLDARLCSHHGGHVHVGAKGALLPVVLLDSWRHLALKVVQQEDLRRRVGNRGQGAGQQRGQAR